MKRVALTISIIFFLFACNNKNQNSYVIEGKAEGFDDGVQIFLKSVKNAGRDFAKDTAIISGEKFTFKGQSEYPEIHLLQLNNPPAVLPFILDNETISVELYKDSLMTSSFTGSPIQKDLDRFNNKMQSYYQTNRELVIKMRNLDYRKDSLERDSLSKIFAGNSSKMQSLPLKFAKENPNSFFSLNLIELETNKPKLDIVSLKEAYNNIDKEIKESPKGVIVKQILDSIYKEYEKTAYLEIGKVAPSFEAPNPDGKTISLDDVKGKVTIIDFWAAWCGPCRKENPNVVRIYNKYHNDGLEIVGVSLDGTPKQNNPRQAWIEAIEKDNLTWNHVSHLEYFNDPVAQLYDIKAIPATYILDEKGTIVAKNLRGVALENKVKELLSK